MSRMGSKHYRNNQPQKSGKTRISNFKRGMRRKFAFRRKGFKAI